MGEDDQSDAGALGIIIEVCCYGGTCIDDGCSGIGIGTAAIVDQVIERPLRGAYRPPGVRITARARYELHDIEPQVSGTGSAAGIRIREAGDCISSGIRYREINDQLGTGTDYIGRNGINGRDKIPGGVSPG